MTITKKYILEAFLTCVEKLSSKIKITPLSRFYDNLFNCIYLMGYSSNTCYYMFLIYINILINYRLVSSSYFEIT